MALTKVIGAGIGSVSGVNLSSGNVTVVDGQGFYFGDGSYRIEGKDDGATTARIGFVAGGSEVARFTSSGLTFGGDTAAANALDDYEEGTATLSFSSSGSTFQYSYQNGFYTKVGRAVHLIVYMQLDGGGNSFSSNTVSITGLPFTSMNNAGHQASAACRLRFVNLGTGFTYLMATVGSNTTTVGFLQCGDNIAPGSLGANQLSSSSGQVMFQLSYFTD